MKGPKLTVLIPPVSVLAAAKMFPDDCSCQIAYEVVPDPAMDPLHAMICILLTGKPSNFTQPSTVTCAIPSKVAESATST